MAKDILIEMDETKNNLFKIISSFPEEHFNKIPFEDSWTAAQVSEHILKSVSGVLEMLYATTKPTERQTNEKAEAIKAIFSDLSIKMKSPEFVLPGNSPIEKENILTVLKDTMDKMIEAIKTLNLSETCTAFVLPGFGEFTRAEWIYFAMYHTQRHTHQLKNIYERMAKESLKV